MNRRSTTWRTLDDNQRAADGDALVDLLLAHPTLIKRPLIERGGEVLALGFDRDRVVGARAAQGQHADVAAGVPAARVVDLSLA